MGATLRVKGQDVRAVLTAFGGHCLLCRKLEMGEQDVERHLRRVGLLVVPAKVLDSASQVKFVVMEILAKGPNVGKWCSKEHSRQYADVGCSGQSIPRPRCMDDIYRVGDMIVCKYYEPERGKSNPCPSVNPETGQPYEEFFVEESAPLAILEP